MEKLQFNLDLPILTPCTPGGINLDRFSSFAPQEYPYQFGIPFGLSSVSLPPVAVPSGLLTHDPGPLRRTSFSIE